MNNSQDSLPDEIFPFHVKDCALVALATGYKAQNLKEFRDGLLSVPEGSIYHHFWGRFLGSLFDEPEYNNDFAAWCYHGLHEKALAERLSVIDPTDFENIETLRQEVVERIEERLDEDEYIPWSRADQQFYFIRSQIVVFFDPEHSITDPSELPETVRGMSRGSIFYHFIDARRRTDDGSDDFSAWFTGWGDKYDDLRLRLQAIDPYFSTLEDLRRTLAQTFEDYFRTGKRT